MTETLAAALAEVQKKLPQIEKHQTAVVKSEKGSYSYAYADLADVSEAILPLLGDVGLSWTCRPTVNTDGKFVLAYALLHVSGDREEGEYPLPNSGTPQAVGAAISYARRYSLCAVTGVAPKGDDDDAAAASAPAKPRQAQRRTAPQRSDPEPAGDGQQKPAQTAQRAARPAAGPPLPHESGADATSDLLSSKQRGMILALFSGGGIEDRDERLDITRRAIGRRDLDSTNRLTVAEASKLIDALQQGEQHPQGFSGWLADLIARDGAS